MYIYFTNTDKDCDLLQDRPVLPTGKTPHDKPATVLTKVKILLYVPEGLNAKTDWLTDWLTVASNSAFFPQIYT
jgi:hypothetical protein